MKTISIIKKVKNRIVANKGKIKRLATLYVNTSTGNKKKEREIIKDLEALKDESRELTKLLDKIEKRKKTMDTMVWKRDKTMIQNIKVNIK